MIVNIDRILQGIDQKLKQADEITSLRETLQLKERIAAEISVAAKKLEREKYREKSDQIKNLIIEVCRLKNIEIEDRGDVLNLDYKGYLSCAVNLSDDARYVSRFENGKKQLGFKIIYSVSVNSFAPGRTVVSTSETERLEKQIDVEEKIARHNNELIEVLRNTDLTVEVKYDDGRSVKINKIEQIVELMFR